MKTFRFEGQGDDTFGEYGVTKEDIDNCGANKPVVFRISAGHDQMVVVGHYHLHPTGAVWTIGIAQMDEDIPVPDWPVRFKTAKNGYSPSLEIDVPDNAELDYYNNRDKAWEEFK